MHNLKKETSYQLAIMNMIVCLVELSSVIIIKTTVLALNCMAQLVGAPFHTPKALGFDSQ